MREQNKDECARIAPGYESLAAVLDEALEQAQAGKGLVRHSVVGERFEDQQIVQLGEWMMASTAFAVGQACKKSLESTRLPYERARAELLGAINYLAAAVIVLDRANAPVAPHRGDPDQTTGDAISAGGGRAYIGTDGRPTRNLTGESW